MKKHLLLFSTIIAIVIFMLAGFHDVYAESNEGTFLIGFDPTLPPYQYVDQASAKGFLIELSQAIFEELQIRVSFMAINNEKATQMLLNGQLDAILGVRYNSNLSEKIIYSDSLVNSTISIVVAKDQMDSVKDKLGIENVLISVERGSTEFEYVKNIRKANFNTAFNQASVVELLTKKRADMMICVRHVAEDILTKHHLIDEYTFLNSYETPIDFYLGTRPDSDLLLNSLNEKLHEFKLSGQYEIIYNKWINDKSVEKIKHIEKVLKVFGVIVFVALIMIVVSIFISYVFKQRVDQKTNELYQTNQQLENKITEIENTNELKNLIFESSPRAIVILDNLRNVLAMNQHACRICQVDAPSVGKSIKTLYPLDEMFSRVAKEALNSGNSYTQQAQKITYSDDVSHYYRYVIYPLTNGNGYIMTIEDITEERILKEQVAETEKNHALMRIIFGIAHEIRNPLTSIKTYAELIPKKLDNDAFKKKITSVIPNEVDRVNQLIENLIDFSREKETDGSRVSIGDLIESVIMLFSPTLKNDDIAFIRQLEGDLFIYADPDQIKQVLINLILNSIDAIKEMRLIDATRSYTIQIDVYCKNKRIYLDFMDNGIGMTDKEQKQIFNLFYTTKQRGSGIGMALSKQMVEDNGGIITLNSTLNKGTVVNISFAKCEVSNEQTNN